jgi:recombinational DNA repair protein (RecF pathway)
VTPAGVQSSAGRTASAVNQQRCAACGQDIADRFLLYAIDRYWHTDCLRCSACQSPLADLGSTCFTRAGMTLCRTDYIRLFGMTGTCSSCRQPIPPNEFVMRTPQDGAVYHVTCFTCVTCHGRLVPGDRYAVVNGRLVCEHDYVKAVRNHLHDQQQQQPAQDGGSGTTLRQQHHKVC